MSKMKTSLLMRVVHRYLGFFLAGIMAVYSVSGITLIFRDTDFLQKERQFERTLAPNLQADAIGKELKIKGMKVTREEGGMLYFEQGTYNQTSGVAQYAVKGLPFVLDKMTKLHKANSQSPLFWLNIFFGLSLFFFVISSFWMFRPQTAIFKKGLYFTLGGIALVLILLFV